MIESYATGLIGITTVLLLWVRVQTAWKRMFPDLSADGDGLAERVGCTGCDRIETCARSPEDARTQEETR